LSGGPKRDQARARRADPASTSLPINQIYPEYPGEWVLVKVTGQNDKRGITHGQVIAHSRHRKTVSKALIRAHAENPGIHTYLFPGGPSPANSREWAEQLAKAGAILTSSKKRR
jgi:hypothetical protein